MESNESNQEDTSQQPTQSPPSKQEGFMTRESEASMQELSDACEKSFREKGYDRRKEGSDRRKEGTDRRTEGADRRAEGSDRRKETLTGYEGVDRRKEGFDRRKETYDRREEGEDRREEGLDRRKKTPKALKIKVGLIILLLAITFCFTVPIPGLRIINDNEYIVTKVDGRAYMKYQSNYSSGQAVGKGLSYQIDGEWTLLTEGTVIAVGSRVIIETGSESTVDIMMDDGMIVRIAKGSTVRLEEKQEKTSRAQAFVTKGKVLINIVSANLKRFKDGPTCKLDVSTPTATCGVRGTIFSVEYQPDLGFTNVSVLEGALNVTDPETAQTSNVTKWFEVRKGQAIQLSNDVNVVTRMDLSNEEMKILLRSAPVLESAHTVFKSIKRAWRSPWWWSTIYAYAREKRTENEIGAIITSMSQKGIMSKGTLPDTLSDKSIPGGDEKDPWGNSYLYVRYETNSALVVSAGPDGKYGTPDDLYRFFSI